MKLYIETENGQAKNHPAFEENLLEAFGRIPNHWEEFIRVEKPEAGAYQVLENNEPVYQKVNGAWTDVWLFRDMTAEEKQAKQQNTISMFRNRDQAENWLAWTLDEITCTMVPPIPRPNPDQTKLNANIFTVWCGAENNWKDTPERPSDGNRYKFDYSSWQWVQVVNSTPI
jgi:hypothetical protein